MTKFLNVLNSQEERQDFNLDDGNTQVIDGSKLVAFPGFIDPHVHFRVPGMEYKEDWIHGSNAAFNGGYTTVFDMPNTNPATTTYERLQAKAALIDSQIQQAALPLNYRLFFGADRKNFQEIAKVKEQIVGLKIFMGSSTGDLLMDDESSLHAAYAIARAFDLPIALHAEDELIIQRNLAQYKDQTDFSYHSLIRSPEAAISAITLVIKLAKLYNVKSYLLHISTKAELDLVRAAKKDNIPIYAETCPHYLFLDESMYGQLSGLAKMNPPVRSIKEHDYLWAALNDGTIDTIASDHAPHTLAEKQQPLSGCPSGVPGIETTVPLMLSAYKRGKITLSRLEALLHTNAKNLFNLPHREDLVFVNIVDYHILTPDRLCTKVQWSPFSGMNLTGYPEYIFVAHKLFHLKK